MISRFCALCEALLFASPDPMPEATLRTILIEEDPAFESDFDSLFKQFLEWAETRESGLTVVRVAGGWQLVTRPASADAVARLKTRRQKARFSRAALEVLAIIAYRQPVTTPEIETIRGVDSAGVLKNLLDKKLVTILGRKKGPGNPLLYGTTQQFLISFGLDDLEALPDLKEFEELIPPPETKLKELPFDRAPKPTNDTQESNIDENP